MPALSLNLWAHSSKATRSCTTVGNWSNLTIDLPKGRNRLSLMCLAVHLALSLSLSLSLTRFFFPPKSFNHLIKGTKGVSFSRGDEAVIASLQNIEDFFGYTVHELNIQVYVCQNLSCQCTFWWANSKLNYIWLNKLLGRTACIRTFHLLDDFIAFLCTNKFNLNDRKT